MGLPARVVLMERMLQAPAAPVVPQAHPALMVQMQVAHQVQVEQVEQVAQMERTQAALQGPAAPQAPVGQTAQMQAVLVALVEQAELLGHQELMEQMLVAPQGLVEHREHQVQTELQGQAALAGDFQVMTTVR